MRIEIIILAAGLGTRMRSSVPKVLHRICGEPLLSILIEQLDSGLHSNPGFRFDEARFNVVVGHGRELVMGAIRGLQQAEKVLTPVIFTVQENQLGTGHAVKLALEQSSQAELVAVFNGDLPLFTREAFNDFLSAHIKNKSSASLASATLDDAGQYGRILRKNGLLTGVVEFKDATPAQRRLREYNGGVYLFDRSLLAAALQKVGSKNASREFYLPDVFGLAKKLKKRIYAHHFDDPTSLAGVNNMKELAHAQSMLYGRKAEELMANGVFLHEPAHTYIGRRVEIGRGCVIGPFTAIHGSSKLGEDVIIGAHCDLNDVVIGDRSLVRNATIAAKSSIGRDCAIGPMAHLRPGTRLDDHVRIGNFVELKESSLGNHTNAAHLSYIGDASVGANVNLGCGFITCNYDGTVREGRRKHRTVIGDDVFVGSDSQLVAPITIADGSFIASGSTVNDSVPEKDSFVIARTRQVTKPGYAKKYKPSSK